MIATEDLIAVFDNYRSLLALCDQLELFADRLPQGLDPGHCRALGKEVLALVKRAFLEEERILFPLLLACSPLMQDRLRTVNRLTVEHRCDACYAEEIADLLGAYANGQPVLCADAAGFMLRGFFENVRRHIACEREILLPLLSNQKA